MKKITKAVIPCGGMGTRFLPITKAVPKEILPIIDTPVLAYIVKEAIDAGITDILIIMGRGKEAIRHYFTPDPYLEKKLREKDNHDLADLVAQIGKGANISFKTQEKPLGSGDALLYAEQFTNYEPFCLAWGDDLMYADTPVLGQLMAAYDTHQASILGVQTVLSDDIVKYGVADPSGKSLNATTRSVQISGIVEKPPLDKLPSRLAALGRYVLTPEIFDIIRNTPTGAGGELQLTDSLNTLARLGKLYAYDFIGKRYDMGDKFGSACAVVDYAARDKNYGARFVAFLKEYVKGL